MDTKLTAQVKKYARELGADLVGIANIERYAKAPLKMSPQGILPTARSVIVCAVKHPDACIELGGRPEPQDIGPYAIQYVMNDRLDVISYKLGRYLDDIGYKSVPIASSNIWRYRSYKELDAIFSPDISHIYSAACAGLGQIGWNGLCITPEYGARNRFVSVITEAELAPDPLYDGPAVCDMCGECIRRCPTDAYRKEVNGVKVLEVENKAWKFANKNLWRCSWGEHFDLDLNLKIPDKVDEQTILEAVKQHGMRGGEMGVCLKVCLPPWLRSNEPEYSDVARRKRHCAPADAPLHRDIATDMVAIAASWSADEVAFAGADTLESAGIHIGDILPDGRSAILLAVRYPLPEPGRLPVERHADAVALYHRIAQFNLDFAVLDMARKLERLGYTALVKSSVDKQALAKACGLPAEGTVRYEAILTSAPFATARCDTSGAGARIRLPLDAHIRDAARHAGADLVGVASAERLNAVLRQLRECKGSETLFQVSDRNTRFLPYDPEVKEVRRSLTCPEDWLKGARSVVVLGLHYPEAVVERAKQPPAEAVGPYVFARYESERLLGHAAFALVKELGRLGYKAAYTHDLLGVGSMVGSPRGPLQSSTNGSIEAVAAGLGQLTPNGGVFTVEYGLNQAFVMVVTDAPLSADAVKPSPAVARFCGNCGKCAQVCPTKALDVKTVNLDIGGESFQYLPVDSKRCDWASRYALCKEEGFGYIGSQTDTLPEPGKPVTAAQLTQALKLLDPVQKYRPVTAECCVVECPLAKGDYTLGG